MREMADNEARYPRWRALVESARALIREQLAYSTCCQVPTTESAGPLPVLNALLYKPRALEPKARPTNALSKLLMLQFRMLAPVTFIPKRARRNVGRLQQGTNEWRA